ncbi:unnamed protein product [Somion occarium]|uniref:Nitrogen regulatory protein areA GATA-like domain-containing protein n=1 Tax=Somion occarium TaxID=3059160 RepID=A0ABP1E2M9_9APHY
MPVPATLTSYLPTLLVKVSNTAVPDDSSFSTLPQGQVDYLSHEWREEDVWRSWRSMTRQKNAIANGMRLENASWRTWWKQRNKLKTINPETLNWLKDSDVTWLYGPLHVGTDWTDYKQQKVTPRKTSFDTISGTRPVVSGVTKPILKRRTISQLLSLPASPFFDHEESEEGSDEEGTLEHPKLLHTKSDTHISWRSRPHRKDSPPRIIAPELPHPLQENSSRSSTDSSNSVSSDQDLSGQSSGPGHKKKHISFNTFVEQCIAIEKPKPKRKSFVGGRASFFHDAAYDGGYDEDSEAGYDYESDEPSSFFIGDREEHPHSDSDDDDDDVLEMRTSSSRSRSSSSSRSRHSPLSGASGHPNPSQSAQRVRPPLVRQASSDRERVTIAPIAPTILKTTGVGNNLEDIVEGRVTPNPKELELVYLPPSNSIYSLPSTPNLGAASLSASEDVYHHRESYFSVGSSSSSNLRHNRSLSAGSLPLVQNNDLARQTSRTVLSSFFGHQSLVVDSPMHSDDLHSEQPDAYDYFGGPDLGEDYGERRSHLGRRRRNSADDKDDEDEGPASRIIRYSQGGASGVSIGRSSASSSRREDWSATMNTSSPRVPSVIVNEVTGAEEEREEESPLSASPMEASTSISGAMPIAIKPVPREDPDVTMGGPMSMGSGPSRTSPIRQGSDQGYLSPSDITILPSRGRSPQCISHSGSTTTGSYSYSSDSRSESRGRSSTRTSSYSDHERSASRGSRGNNSPLGSISPTGSAVAIGASHQTRGRDRDREARSGSTSSAGGGSSRSCPRVDEERGRDRSGRRLENSMSPPSAVGSPVRVASDVEYQPYSPELLGAQLDNPRHSIGSTRTSSPPSIFVFGTYKFSFYRVS